MVTRHDTIAMAAIDFDSLAESQDNHEAVQFDILLTSTPDSKWVDEFEIAYRTMPYSIKPPVEVVGDRLRVAFLPRYDRDIQGYIEYLKTVMRKADTEVDLSESISQRGNRPEKIELFRQTLKNVRVGAG